MSPVSIRGTISGVLHASYRSGGAKNAELTFLKSSAGWGSENRIGW
jgi:hypothetical protein